MIPVPAQPSLQPDSCSDSRDIPGTASPSLHGSEQGTPVHCNSSDSKDVNSTTLSAASPNRQRKKEKTVREVSVRRKNSLSPRTNEYTGNLQFPLYIFPYIFLDITENIGEKITSLTKFDS